MQTTETTTQDDLKRLGEEIELKIHLASMDARDQWAELKKRLATIQHHAGQTLSNEVAVIGQALRKLRDEVFAA